MVDAFDGHAEIGASGRNACDMTYEGHTKKIEIITGVCCAVWTGDHTWPFVSFMLKIFVYNYSI